MRKENIFMLIIFTVSMFLFTGNVFAAEEVCSVNQLSELRQMASAVKITYLPVTEVKKSEYNDLEVGADTYTARYLDIKIYNLNTRLYVDVENSEGYRVMVTQKDAGPDGTITFRQEALPAKVDYTFTIKSYLYGCETDVLRTIRLSLPIYNPYSQLDICSEIPDYYLCQEYTTYQVDGATFYDRVDDYKAKLIAQGELTVEEEDNTNGVNKVFSNASKYKYLIVGVIVALGVVITVVVIKRKENA